MLEEENVTSESLKTTITDVMANRQTYIHAMEASGQMDAIATIMSLIEEATK